MEGSNYFQCQNCIIPCTLLACLFRNFAASLLLNNANLAFADVIWRFYWFFTVSTSCRWTFIAAFTALWTKRLGIVPEELQEAFLLSVNKNVLIKNDAVSALFCVSACFTFVLLVWQSGNSENALQIVLNQYRAMCRAHALAGALQAQPQQHSSGDFSGNTIPFWLN